MNMDRLGGVSEPGRSERRKRAKSDTEVTGVFNRSLRVDDDNEKTGVFKKPTRSEKAIPVAEKDIIDEEEVVDLDQKILPVAEEDILEEEDDVVELDDKITPLEDSDILEEEQVLKKPTKVFKRKPELKLLTPEDHKENSRKRVEKRKAQSAQEEKEQVADLKNMQDLIINSKAHEAEEVADLKKIRKSILNESTDVEKLDAEIKAGFKSANEQGAGRSKAKQVNSSRESSAQRTEAKSESEKVENAKIFAENAIRAYSKLLIELYPDTVNKIYEGKKESSDRVGAFDLVAITPPPLRAIFSSKGRHLRDVYGQVQEAIKRYNDEVEADLE